MGNTTKLEKELKKVEKQLENGSKLTAREREILGLMEQGLSFKEACERLKIPKGHLVRDGQRLAGKVGFPRWSEVLRRGINDKLVQKVLKEGLKAEKVVAVRIIGQKAKELLTVPDHEIRLKAAELAMKYSQEHDATRPITINIIRPGEAKANILVMPQQSGSLPELENPSEP